MAVLCFIIYYQIILEKQYRWRNLGLIKTSYSGQRYNEGDYCMLHFGILTETEIPNHPFIKMLGRNINLHLF